MHNLRISRRNLRWRIRIAELSGGEIEGLTRVAGLWISVAGNHGLPPLITGQCAANLDGKIDREALAYRAIVVPGIEFNLAQRIGRAEIQGDPFDVIRASV